MRGAVHTGARDLTPFRNLNQETECCVHRHLDGDPGRSGEMPRAYPTRVRMIVGKHAAGLGRGAR